MENKNTKQVIEYLNTIPNVDCTREQIYNLIQSSETVVIKMGIKDDKIIRMPSRQTVLEPDDYFRQDKKILFKPSAIPKLVAHFSKQSFMG